MVGIRLHDLVLGFASFSSPGVYVADPSFPLSRRNRGMKVLVAAPPSPPQDTCHRVFWQLLPQVLMSFRSIRVKHRYRASQGSVALAMLVLNPAE